jgi:hypothetical protein
MKPLQAYVLYCCRTVKSGAIAFLDFTLGQTIASSEHVENLGSHEKHMNVRVSLILNGSDPRCLGTAL